MKLNFTCGTWNKIALNYTWLVTIPDKVKNWGGKYKFGILLTTFKDVVILSLFLVSLSFLSANADGIEPFKVGMTMIYCGSLSCGRHQELRIIVYGMKSTV